MSIRYKLLLGCLGLTVITILLGTYAHGVQRALGSVAVRLYDETLLAVTYLRSAESGLIRVEGVWRRHDPAAGQEDLRAEAETLLRDVMDDLEVAAERAMSPEGQAATSRVREELKRLSTTTRDGSPLDTLAHVEQVGSGLGVALEIYAADGFRYRHNVGEMVERSVNRIWLAITGSIAVALVITLLLTRSIVPRLHKAVGIAEAIAAGRLDNHIETSGRGETFQLARALSAMQASIAAAMAHIRTQHLQLEAALDNMKQGLCLFDADSRLVVHNRSFARMFGAPEPAATYEQVLRVGGLGVLLDQDKHGTSTTLSCDLPDGRTIAISHQPVTGGGWVATYEDITDRRAAEMRLVHMARHDALTGLPNRTLLSEHMVHGLARARRGGSLAVLCLDLDRFKAVNDSLGHAVGDALLCAVARRLQDFTRETDLIVRLGGDEFVIVQEDARQPTEASALAARLVEALAIPFEVAGHQAVIGASIGIALSGDGVNSYDALLRCADLALYRAKADGRGTYHFFEAEMDARLQARRALELDLRRAVAEQQFVLFYQPIMEVRTAGVSGFEALVRWQHPQRGLVSPAEFIPVAEETGLIGAIGTWVLHQACADAAGWPGALKVAVNLSPMQFRGGALAAEVALALATSGLPATRLELEITESVLLQDDEAVLATLHVIRATGVRISMDDFGTGYSSLSYLRRFPFDKIKIDQSFVHGMAEREDCGAIVRAVIGLGWSLGMVVVAEGVETEAQLASLRTEGCGELQGYLFGRPRPVSEVGDVLCRHGVAPCVHSDTSRALCVTSEARKAPAMQAVSG